MERTAGSSTFIIIRSAVSGEKKSETPNRSMIQNAASGSRAPHVRDDGAPIIQGGKHDSNRDATHALVEGV